MWFIDTFVSIDFAHYYHSVAQEINRLLIFVPKKWKRAFESFTELFIQQCKF